MWKFSELLYSTSVGFVIITFLTNGELVQKMASGLKNSWTIVFLDVSLSFVLLSFFSYRRHS